jgi:hypothetical protein
MEYRKKHLKPKQDLDVVLGKALNDEEFMYKIEFIGALRKIVFMN